MRRSFLLTIVLLALAGCGGAKDAPPNERPPGADSPGWDLMIVSRDGWRTDFSRHTVPLVQFSRGGPGKDGIPALDRPRFVAVDAAPWLDPTDPVIELQVAGDARAYPLEILVWHEIVNDSIAGVPLAVTFCPLCNAAVAFDRRLDGRELSFGVSGILRYSDLVMYDRETESWWQQFSGEAVVGELSGETLRRVPATVVSWEGFRETHPDGSVLTRDTGYDRPYGSNPYAGYDEVDSPTLFGTPNQTDGRVPLKERVVFVEREGQALAVPFSELQRRLSIRVALGEDELDIRWRPGATSAFASLDGAPREVGTVAVELAGSHDPVLFDTPFWFAVAAFRPDVLVWSPDRLVTREEAPRRRWPRAGAADIVDATGRLAG